MLTNTSDIELHADIWLRNLILFYYYNMPLHKQNRMQLLLYTIIQRCMRMYCTMYVREFTLFHGRSQWSCSHHSLTKTENFAVFSCYAPLRAPSPSTYNKKNDTSSFATTRVVVAKETTPSVCFSQYIIK